MVDLAVHLDLHDGLHLGPFAVLPVDGTEADQLEGVAECAQGLPSEYLDRGLRGFEDIAFVLEMLDLLEQSPHRGMALVQVGEQMVEPVGDGGAARLFREQEPPLVAHQGRTAMLVGRRVLHHRVDVHPALVREGAFAHVGLPVVVVDVRHLTQEAGEVHQLPKALFPEAALPELDLQVGDDRAEIGVPASLAVAVERSLDLNRAELDGDDAVGHTCAGIVVRVDAEGRLDPFCRCKDDLAQLGGQNAPVGVTQDQEVGAAFLSGLQGTDRVVRIGLVAVEVVLGVVDYLSAVALEIGDRIADQFQVLVESGSQHVGDVERPALAEDGDDVGCGLEKRAERGVVFGWVGGTTRAPEGRDPRVGKREITRLQEELQVFRVGGVGPAALDIVDPQIIQSSGHHQLVVDGKGDVFRLGTVAKGAIVDLYVVWHRISSGRESGSRASERRPPPLDRSGGPGKPTARQLELHGTLLSVRPNDGRATGAARLIPPPFPLDFEVSQHGYLVIVA